MLLFPLLHWASVERPAIFLGAWDPCVWLLRNMLHVHISCMEMWWGGILSLDQDWSYSWEKKKNKKSRKNWGWRHFFCPAHSVLADVNWHAGWLDSTCVYMCLCVSLHTSVHRHIWFPWCCAVLAVIWELQPLDRARRQRVHLCVHKSLAKCIFLYCVMGLILVGG